MDAKIQIEALEARLIEAMKTSNIDELQELLSDDLIFTNQHGHLVTKEDDLNMHRSGDLEIYTLETSAQIINAYDGVAVVSVVQNLGGAVNGNAYVGIFRYTRVLKYNGAAWQVVAGHVSQIIT